MSSTLGSNYTDQCSIIKDRRTISFWLPSALTTMSEGQKTGIKLWKPWSSLHFHYFTALQHFPLDACLLVSLSSPQFPWCLTCCLQTTTVLLHCSGILKIYTATYSVKLHYMLICYKLIYYTVFSLWIFDYDILSFCSYLCLFCLMFFGWAFAFSSCHLEILSFGFPPAEFWRDAVQRETPRRREEEL